jgi:hypothetical protein
MFEGSDVIGVVISVPNFALLDATLPDVARLLTAMMQARDAVESRSWSHPQEPTTEVWWADVIADPRARTPKRRGSEVAVERTFYRLADLLEARLPPISAGTAWSRDRPSR